jgi:hypothetical protein
MKEAINHIWIAVSDIQQMMKIMKLIVLLVVMVGVFIVNHIDSYENQGYQHKQTFKRSNKKYNKLPTKIS